MKFELINKPNPKYSALEQVLTNRGIPHDEIEHYLHTTEKDVASPLMFGEHINDAINNLIDLIKVDTPGHIIIDSDDDGFTAAAIFINYMHRVFPKWVEEQLTWHFHEKKAHGLGDLIDDIDLEVKKNKFATIVILPDSSSNDYEYHKQLYENGAMIFVLDHHDAEKVSDYAFVINNQLSDYPNKSLSGAGVVYQFCRQMDQKLGVNYANDFIDLCALGLIGDMMSLIPLETRYLVNEGVKVENIHNPFIYEMWQKNKFKLGDKITPWGATFYIVPLINAINRSGTLEEKQIVFSSMINYKANELVPSTKRGHKLGEQERIVEQAVRICTNVKNRQTKAQNDGMEFLERMIETEKLLDNKVLLFLMSPGEIDQNIAGLIANKMMAKYQRPCCILTATKNDKGQVCYAGSARGCDKVGIIDFKKICLDTECVEYAEGHPGAFGLSIRADEIGEFLDKTNKMLENMSDEPIYFVDYIYYNGNVNGQEVIDIANMGDLWGKDIDEAKVAIEDLCVTPQMVTLMSPTKNPSLKITLPNQVCLIKFGIKDEEYEQFMREPALKINIVGTCNANEWLGRVTPQIFIEDYEVLGAVKYVF